MPWTPLSHFAGSPRRIVARCREIIDRVPKEAERANLLAVTQIFTQLRYNDPELLTILGGSRIMIDSPLLREIEERGRVQAHIADILGFLEERFGDVPGDLRARLSEIRDEPTLEVLVRRAARCEDVAAFRAQLPE